jgi:hypothetical protein
MAETSIYTLEKFVGVLPVPTWPTDACEHLHVTIHQ